MILISQDRLRIYSTDIHHTMDRNLRSIVTKLSSTDFAFEIMAVAFSYNTLILMTTQGLYVCGGNKYNRIGLEDPNLIVLKPVRLNFDHQVLIVACSSITMFAYTTDGLYATGVNNYGQLGLKPCDTVPGLTKIEFDHKVVSIVCKSHHTFIHSADGVYACGNNENGLLGIVGVDQVSGLTKLDTSGDIISVSCSDYHTIVHTCNRIYLCGVNSHNQLSFIPNLDSLDVLCPPRQISSSRIGVIRCRAGHTFFTTVSGHLYVMGLLYGYVYKRVHIPLNYPIEDVFLPRNHIVLKTANGLYKLIKSISARGFTSEKLVLPPVIMPGEHRRFGMTKSARN